MAAPDLHPVELIVLQGNSFCNLNCSYCDLSVESRRTKAVMPAILIEKLFDELFRSGRLAREITIVWHSGEPLTLPPSYYDDAIALILDLKESLAGDSITVRFKIQTNAVLIDKEWCALFKRHASVLEVGVSCDGPAQMHDAYRRNWAGRNTHGQTLRGMARLAEAEIPYKLIAVVTRETLAAPDLFFTFFLERRAQLSGYHFNVLAGAQSTDPALAYSSSDREAYYHFYRRLLTLAHQAATRGLDFKIQNFSQSLSRIIMASTENAPLHYLETSAPLKSLSVDAHGNLTTFYAGLGIDVLKDEYADGRGLSIGNIYESSFETMVQSEKLQAIARDFTVSMRACERSCPYFTVCPGGYEITKKLSFGTFDAAETTECIIHVKALVDALLDDIAERLERRPPLTHPSSSYAASELLTD